MELAAYVAAAQTTVQLPIPKTDKATTQGNNAGWIPACDGSKTRNERPMTGWIPNEDNAWKCGKRNRHASNVGQRNQRQRSGKAGWIPIRLMGLAWCTRQLHTRYPSAWHGETPGSPEDSVVANVLNAKALIDLCFTNCEPRARMTRPHGSPTCLRRKWENQRTQ